MPAETFFNLGKKKRQKIIEAAQEEFANHSFSESSVSGIIEKADIPRGSFYQYFTDLEDTYKYVMKLLAQKKMEFFKQRLSEFEEMDTFPLIRKLYRLGIEFINSHPRLGALGNNFLKEEREFKKRVIENFQGLSLNFYEKIIQRGRERGEIDKEVNISVLTNMLIQMNVFLLDYYIEQYSGRTSKDKPLEDMGQYLELVDDMLYIFEKGIRSRNKIEN